MATTTNNRLNTEYNLASGETYDLLSFDFPDGYPNSKLEFVFGSVPRKITGVQKVAQIFLKCLLTTKGSDLLDTTAGTQFPNYMKYSNITSSDTSEIYTVLYSSIQDAVSQAKFILNSANVSRESQLSSVDIVNIIVKEEGYDIALRLLTKAGTTALVSVPFTSTGLTYNTELTANG